MYKLYTIKIHNEIFIKFTAKNIFYLVVCTLQHCKLKTDADDMLTYYRFVSRKIALSNYLN